MPTYPTTKLVCWEATFTESTNIYPQFFKPNVFQYILCPEKYQTKKLGTVWLNIIAKKLWFGLSKGRLYLAIPSLSDSLLLCDCCWIIYISVFCRKFPKKRNLSMDEAEMKTSSLNSSQTAFLLPRSLFQIRPLGPLDDPTLNWGEIGFSFKWIIFANFTQLLPNLHRI